jgi:hypothetical protein
MGLFLAPLHLESSSLKLHKLCFSTSPNFGSKANFLGSLPRYVRYCAAVPAGVGIRVHAVILRSYLWIDRGFCVYARGDYPIVTLPLFHPDEVAGNPLYQQATRDLSGSVKSCKKNGSKNLLPVDISA